MCSVFVTVNYESLRSYIVSFAFWFVTHRKWWNLGSKHSLPLPVVFTRSLSYFNVIEDKFLIWLKFYEPYKYEFPLLLLLIQRIFFFLFLYDFLKGTKNWKQISLKMHHEICIKNQYSVWVSTSCCASFFAVEYSLSNSSALKYQRRDEPTFLQIFVIFSSVVLSGSGT